MNTYTILYIPDGHSVEQTVQRQAQNDDEALEFIDEYEDRGNEVVEVWETHSRRSVWQNARY